MLNADVLTFQEFATREILPLATIHESILEFLQGRKDTVLFGAQAVNAYVSEPRMTQDVDLLSMDAKNLAEELKNFLSDKFHIAVRIRKVADGKGFRVYQLRSEGGNRHLIDLRAVADLPQAETIENILVLSPVELMASKIISYHSRRGKPKAGTDYRDLGMLMLRFPELKEKVSESLRTKNVGEAVLETWAEISSQDFQVADEDEDLTLKHMPDSTKIIIERHEDGFVAYPLGLKGVVVGEGDTFEDALANVKSAISFHIETFGEEAFEDDSPVLEAFVAETKLAA